MSSETGQSSNSSEKLSVIVTFGEMKAEFSGTPEAVIQSVNGFISKNIPGIDLAKRLALNFSAKDLVEKFKDYVKITPEGPKVWNQEQDLSDKEIVALQLVAHRISSETRAGGSASATLNSLQESMSLNPKSLSSRLSEMTKAGYVVRQSDNGVTSFRISTIGVEWLCSILLRKE